MTFGLNHLRFSLTHCENPRDFFCSSGWKKIFSSLKINYWTFCCFIIYLCALGNLSLLEHKKHHLKHSSDKRSAQLCFLTPFLQTVWEVMRSTDRANTPYTYNQTCRALAIKQKISLMFRMVCYSYAKRFTQRAFLKLKVQWAPCKLARSCIAFFVEVHSWVHAHPGACQAVWLASAIAPLFSFPVCKGRSGVLWFGDLFVSGLWGFFSEYNYTAACVLGKAS